VSIDKGLLLPLTDDPATDFGASWAPQPSSVHPAPCAVPWQSPKIVLNQVLTDTTLLPQPAQRPARKSCNGLATP
jgi:hypothetical protein